MAQDGPIELFRWILDGWQQLFSKVGEGRAQKCQCLLSILALGCSIEPFRWIFVGWQQLSREFPKEKLKSSVAYYPFEIYILIKMMAQDGPMKY